MRPFSLLQRDVDEAKQHPAAQHGDDDAGDDPFASGLLLGPSRGKERKGKENQEK